MKIRDFVIIGIIALWLILSVVYAIKRKKSGKSISCGGDCSRCACCCHSSENREKN